MKRVKLLCTLALLCITMQNTWAQLATWTYTNTGAWGPSPLAPTTSDANLTIGGLTRGSGLTISGTSSNTAWGANGYTDGIAVASQTMASAIANGNFFSFTITATSGNSVSLSNIGVYNIRRSGTGPSSYIWQYSLDGTNFTSIGATIIAGGNTTSTGNAQPAVSLSGITDLQNVPSGTVITFRVPAWGATGDAGTFYFNGASTNPNLTINGTMGSTPLPLDLVAFKGVRENSTNLLQWSTAQEKHVSHFELERGTDGRNFTKLAEILSTGNDNTANNQYSYSDMTSGASAYYRLRMVDMDGRARYSDIVALYDGATSGNIHLYPNPAQSILFVEGIDSKSTYSITDAIGREAVSNTRMNAEGTTASINVSGLAPGNYFLQLTSGNKRDVIRFVKK